VKKNCITTHYGDDEDNTLDVAHALHCVPSYLSGIEKTDANTCPAIIKTSDL